MWRQDDAVHMAVRPVSVRIVILTKEPIPGRVKTRLIPALGPEGAATFHGLLVWETIRLAQQSGLPIDVSLAGDLNGRFATDLRNQGVCVESQVDGDLGARMAYALRGPGRRVALGTDCVTFQPEWIVQAAESSTQVAIGPAEDGGYWCITVDVSTPGLFPTLFQKMNWSTSTVLDITKKRLTQAGHSITWLPTTFDVDVPSDLPRLKQHPSCPPHIRAALNAI